MTDPELTAERRADLEYSSDTRELLRLYDAECAARIETRNRLCADIERLEQERDAALARAELKEAQVSYAKAASERAASRALVERIEAECQAWYADKLASECMDKITTLIRASKKEGA